MKRLLIRLCVCISVLVLMFTTSGAEGILPLFGSLEIELPSISSVLGRGPDSEEKTDDGSLKQTFMNVTREDYSGFSVYLGQQDCTVESYSVDGNTLNAILRKGDATFIFSYNAETGTAELSYPAGTCPEKSETIAAEEPGNPSGTIAVGDFITFGSYEQDNNPDNGAEPIEWQVLDVRDGKVLLLSKYGLDVLPYEDYYVNPTWETCSLRAWLNENFLNAAFSAEEQQTILLTNVDNSQSQGYYTTYSGHGSQDKLFLLSYNEVFNTYFAEKETRLCAPTDYAIAKGAYKRSSHKIYDRAAGRWWLRSPGGGEGYALTVYDDGNRSDCKAKAKDVTVRPALWMNLGTGDPDSSTVAIGETVAFGHYEQDNNRDNGAEPIEWLVLDVQGNQALLFSRYCLDCKAFNNESGGSAWDKSTVRAWLNNDFLNAAFTANEQQAVLLTDVDNSELQGSAKASVTGGNATKDKLFLLSYHEAFNQYLWNNEARKCLPTDYAVAQGVLVLPIDQLDGKDTCMWWLRSPYDPEKCLNINFYGVELGNSVGAALGIRPAFWIDLEAAGLR